MILKSLIAILGMAAIGWMTWRLVNRQSEPEGLDDPVRRKSASSNSDADASTDGTSH